MKKRTGSIIPKLNVSIIVTVFNYENYIDDCIKSILKQERFKEIVKDIIIVNDGSTDNSLEIINKYKNINKIKIINKKNGGQLSAFNEAIKYCAGNIICFLDADDIYKENYISTIVNYYSLNKNCDALIVNKEYFGNDNYIDNLIYNGEYGFSLFETVINHSWIGVATSAFSVKKEILLKVLPLYEIESDWKVRADDCIIFGTSLVGANKCFLNKTLVKYRIHGNNLNYNKTFSKEYCYKRILAIEKLINIILSKNNIVLTPRLLYFEYITKQNIGIKLMIKYIKILLRTNFNLINKAILLVKIFKFTVLKKRKNNDWRC